jgi:predicted class III extradiol MEMO1 family dioxygenase
MRLLACNEAYFSQEIVEMLWVCASEKHEDITRATLELIQDLAQFMPLERLAQFSMKLKVIKESDFDEKLVNFLKQFTLNAMKNIRNFKLASSKGQGIVSNIMNKKKEVKIDETKYIDLTLFWQIF